MLIWTWSLSHFITSYWKTRLPHVCIPMTEMALESACRLLIVFACFCLLRLLVREIFANCSWLLLCLCNIVPVSLENYRQLQWMHTFRLLGIYDLCLLLQREPAQVCLTCELCKIFSEPFFKLWFYPWECTAFYYFKSEALCCNEDRKAETKSLMKEF